MWFDVTAALAEIEAERRSVCDTEPQAALSTPAPASLPVSQLSRVSQPPEAATGSRNVANVANVARPPARQEPATEKGRRHAACLPSAPPMCAVCGVADWHVSLTEPDGRKQHVACWAAGATAEAEATREAIASEREGKR